MTLKGEVKRAYQRNWMASRRKEYIDKLGDCIFCGSPKIQIHHVDSDDKVSHKIWSWSRDKLEAELAKCVAMCRSCHSKFHALLKRRKVKHGSNAGYRIGCRCFDCRAAHANEQAQYQQKKRIENQLIIGG